MSPPQPNFLFKPLDKSRSFPNTFVYGVVWIMFWNHARFVYECELPFALRLQRSSEVSCLVQLWHLIKASCENCLGNRLVK